MKLKTAKWFLLAGCVLMALFLLLCAATERKVFGYVGAGFAFASLIFWIIFGRCPACGGFLGRSSGKHCPHCGKELKW